MSRVHVVLDSSSVPIFADLVGFFHGGPLDQSLMFTDKRRAPDHHDDWIVIGPENPIAGSLLGFAGLDNRRDSYSLRVYLLERVPVQVFGEPVHIEATGIFHDYLFRILPSIFGDVRVYLSSEATRPESLPHWFVEALDRSFHDRIRSVSRAAGEAVLSFDAMRAGFERLRDMGFGGVVPLESLLDIGSSTACFECGATVKTEHVWLKKSDPNVALCEGCFRAAEIAGRAKEGSHAN